MSKARNIFITGGNRGIGLGLVEEIIKHFKPENLFATFRESSSAQKLEALAATNPCLHLIQMDVRADDTKLKQVVKIVDEKTKGAGLNLLINNSGVASRSDLQGITKEEMMTTFEVNAVAPLLIAKALLPLLEKASTNMRDVPLGIARAAIVNVSTILASIANVSGGPPGMYIYAYRSSKAALNMATAALSLELAHKNTGVIAVVLHPGWVQTDMGGSNAAITTSESVTGILNVLQSLDESKNGKFFDWQGKELPW